MSCVGSGSPTLTDQMFPAVITSFIVFLVDVIDSRLSDSHFNFWIRKLIRNKDGISLGSLVLTPVLIMACRCENVLNIIFLELYNN